jgi:hypothetical protein
MANIEQQLPAPIAEAIATAIQHEKRLIPLGFEQDEFGQWFIQGECRIVLYRVDDTWELDITLPNGSVIGGDLPCSGLVGRSAAERAGNEF